jgi:hypothetical protein
MKKKFGIFQLDTASRYITEGANRLIFLDRCRLHDTEEDAAEWFPSHDGYYLILPVYVKTEQQDSEKELQVKLEFLDSLGKAFKK